MTFVTSSSKQSISSQVMTQHHLMRVKIVDDQRYAVADAPADITILARCRLLLPGPHPVISAISSGGNSGGNLIHSGTAVAGQGRVLQGVPPLAILQVLRNVEDFNPRQGYRTPAGPDRYS